MIPAPNLATGRPPTDGRNNAAESQDSYDSPQAPAIGSGIAPTASANPFLDTSAPPLSIYGSAQPAGDIIVGTGKAEAPSGESNLVNIGGQFSQPDPNIDEYGSPVEPAVGPITDIDIPAGAGAILPGVEPRGEPDVDVYGSPLAPVGTSAPVPQDVLKQIEDNLDGIDSVITNDISDDVPEGELVSATEEEDEYDEIEKEVIEDLVDQIKTELDDPTAITDPEEEKFLKEVINTIEYIENEPSGEGSGDILPSATGGEDQQTYGGSIDDRGNAIDDEPLFDNVREEVGGDPPATGTPGPTIDLGGGFVDLSNGVLSDSSNGQSTPGEINLTGTTTPAASDESEVITEAPEQTDYDNTYDDGLDQAISASTPIPQYEDSYDNVDVSYADIVDDIEKDADVDITSLGDYNEVLDEDEYVETAEENTDSAVDEEEDEGYNIPIPDNPLDSSLSEYDDIAGSGDEYADIGEEYEAGDYEEPPDPVDNDIEYEAPEEEIEEEPEITTSRPSLISIPLVIEEKDEDVLATGNQGGDPTVILAGTDEERRPDTLYGGPIDGYEDEDALRRARQTNANSPAHSQGVRVRPPQSFQYVDPPQSKRQVKAKDLPVTRLLSGRGGQDWSQRLRERQRQRIWRQFNLDRRQGRVYFNQHHGA
jgi:hypothetical protein